MDNIEWLFFDVGETLVNEGECYNHRIREIVEGTGVTFEQFYSKVLSCAHTSFKPVLDAIISYGLPPLKKPWHKEDETLYSDSESTLKKLFERGYKIGIIANQSEGTESRLEAWGLMKYIKLVVASAEEGVSKPDPEIFRRALSRADCAPERTVMIGDRLDNDIFPAKSVGMKTVWIKQGFSGLLTPESEAYTADFTISRLSELTDIL